MERCPICHRYTAEKCIYTGKLSCYHRMCNYREWDGKRETMSYSREREMIEEKENDKRLQLGRLELALEMVRKALTDIRELRTGTGVGRIEEVEEILAAVIEDMKRNGAKNVN